MHEIQTNVTDFVTQGSVNISTFEFSLSYYALNRYTPSTADNNKCIFYIISQWGSPYSLVVSLLD